MPLPASLHETAVWSTATIQPDYLIKIGIASILSCMNLSVRKSISRVTENSIEVFTTTTV